MIVGRSNLVGKPLMSLLIRKSLNATVTLCHTGTADLASYCRSADILIACAGSVGLVRGDWIKPGACVIDVGVNRVEDPTAKKGFRLKGDVEYEAAAQAAGWITPVPGGVGPMTITMLLANTVEAAAPRRSLRSSMVDIQSMKGRAPDPHPEGGRQGSPLSDNAEGQGRPGPAHHRGRQPFR